MHLRKSLFGLFQLVLLLFILLSLGFIVCSRDAWRVIADDSLDVLVFGFLLEVLELELAEECLRGDVSVCAVKNACIERD